MADDRNAEQRSQQTFSLTSDLTGAPQQASAPETTDPNFAVTHPDVGHDGKAGKAAAAAQSDMSASRGRVSGAMPMTVRDVMTPLVEVATPQTELYSVARMMADRDVGAIPIVENTDSMKPIGMITDRDIVVRALARRQDPGAMRAGDCMSSGVITCKPDDDLHECTERMEREQVRRIVVVDAFGRCVGIVAQADIATKTMMSTTADLVREVSRPDGAAEQRRYH